MSLTGCQGGRVHHIFAGSNDSKKRKHNMNTPQLVRGKSHVCASLTQNSFAYLLYCSNEG